MSKVSNPRPIFRWVGLFAAVGLLNVSLAFAHVWPTLFVRWGGELSVEAAACVLGILLTHRWLGRPSQASLRWLAGLWVVLVLGRYSDVTARSLYGRDINLYWDLRLMPDVSAMFVF